MYRLSPKRHHDIAYSGSGASKSPGRWNLAGTPMVYTSATESLAFLELFVHLPTITLQSLDREYESVAAEITGPIYTVHLTNLPADWRDLASLSRKTQELGTLWMEELKHLVISVPSAVFPGERNYLINPKHPDFATHCSVQPEQPIFPDPRIIAKLA